MYGLFTSTSSHQGDFWNCSPSILQQLRQLSFWAIFTRRLTLQGLQSLDRLCERRHHGVKSSMAILGRLHFHGSGDETLGPTSNGKEKEYLVGSHRVTFCICRSHILCPHIDLPRAQQKNTT